MQIPFEVDPPKKDGNNAAKSASSIPANPQIKIALKVRKEHKVSKVRKYHTVRKTTQSASTTQSARTCIKTSAKTTHSYTVNTSDCAVAGRQISFFNR